MKILKSFVPDAGGIFGDTKWTSEVTGTVRASGIGTKVQSTKLKVDHQVWVYFASAQPKPSYFVIHHMKVEANPNVGQSSPVANRTDARGFFNSSLRVGYRNTPTVSAGSSLTELIPTPNGGQDEFDASLDGPQVSMFSRAGSTVVFNPTYQIRNRVEKWSLQGESGPPAWELHQRDVWDALGVDGPEDGKNAVSVPPDWWPALFGGSPFGRVSEMPKASFGPVKCEMLARWQIDGPFTDAKRDATLTIGVDYTHRVNLFHNGNVGDDNEPRRICWVFSKTDESKVLKLHEIAVPS